MVKKTDKERNWTCQKSLIDISIKKILKRNRLNLKLKMIKI